MCRVFVHGQNGKGIWGEIWWAGCGMRILPEHGLPGTPIAMDESWECWVGAEGAARCRWGKLYSMGNRERCVDGGMRGMEGAAWCRKGGCMV